MSSSPVVLSNYINGVFEPVDEKIPTVPVISPGDETVLAYVPLCNRSNVDHAVEIAQRAFEDWSNMTIKQRAAIMFRFHHLMEVHAQELAEIIVRENGKNITEALADVAKGNETAEWASSLPQVAGGRTMEVSRGIVCQESRQPLGVVAAIVPFNFPAMVPMWTIPISLTMGNCVILKPSEKVPLTMQRIASLLAEAGVPPGVFQIVHGAVDVVTSFCDHPGISAVSFVGSSKVANIVAQRCHATNKRVLALGGAKNHLVALPDCDVSMAARDIVASFAGCCGQRCMAASVLVLVDEDRTNTAVLDSLLEQVVAASAALKLGQGPGQVGPLIDSIARERVLSYIQEVEQSKTVSILLDGRSLAAHSSKGWWMGPTILLHTEKTDRALQDEIFGPVLSVIRVSSREEAIAIENGNPYGNAACIYTERGCNAEWFTKRFRAGMLGVNIGIPVPREPFSFGGLYGTLSKFGTTDVTGDGAMEFFSNRIKITTKWSAAYGSGAGGATAALPAAKRAKSDGNGSTTAAGIEDKANFDGRM